MSLKPKLDSELLFFSQHLFPHGCSWYSLILRFLLQSSSGKHTGIKLKAPYFHSTQYLSFMEEGLHLQNHISVHNVIYLKAIPCSDASTSSFRLQGETSRGIYVFCAVPDCSEEVSALQCGSQAFCGSPDTSSHGSQPATQRECWANNWRSDASSSSADAPAARGEDYVTSADFSGWGAIISKAPDHSVMQHALIYCQNEQINK